MVNMDYCRFQNTLKDLKDCNDHLWDDPLSTGEEAKARLRLIELCAKIAVDAGLCVYDEESEEE